MTGVLTIHCITASSSQLGHSWIEYCPIDGQPHTYSTWGNHPRGRANGLLVDMDLRFKSDVSRSRILDAEQEKRLTELIHHYRLLGDRGWQLLAPCSAFAADVWQHATGEALAHRTAYISNPTTLANAIRRANANDGRLDGPAMPAASPGVRTAEQPHKRHSRSTRRH